MNLRCAKPVRVAEFKSHLLWCLGRVVNGIVNSHDLNTLGNSGIHNSKNESCNRV
jgi:hypothetical protein